MTREQLRERRQALAMSQAELAEYLGVPQQSVSRWETGERRINDVRGFWLAAKIEQIEHEQRRSEPTIATERGE